MIMKTDTISNRYVPGPLIHYFLVLIIFDVNELVFFSKLQHFRPANTSRSAIGDAKFPIRAEFSDGKYKLRYICSVFDKIHINYFYCHFEFCSNRPKMLLDGLA